MQTVLKSGSLNLLETSGLVQACNGIVLPLPPGIKSLKWFSTFRFQAYNTRVQSLVKQFERRRPNVRLRIKWQDSFKTLHKEIGYGHMGWINVALVKVWR